jgi:hypothetical protein
VTRDLICFPHLRWDFAYQRRNLPVARAARERVRVKTPLIPQQRGRTWRSMASLMLELEPSTEREPRTVPARQRRDRVRGPATRSTGGDRVATSSTEVG